MVFVNDRKYACETCIKGHRSSTCKHTDRPLFEIKKKGRPVTQCEHCRELRKTKQVHVKCMCGAKDDGEGASGSVQGGVKVPVSAAFPSGLPEALEASVALQLMSDGSDSEHGSSACSCKDSGTCHCATPRAPRSKRYGKATVTQRRGSTDGLRMTPKVELPPQMSQPAALVANAHSGDYRPVLPRPSPSQPALSSASPTHDASLASKIHASRFQSHNQMHYSPYGRAYEYTHSSDLERPNVQFHSTDTFSAGTSLMPSWVPTFNAPPSDSSNMTSVLCGCGSSCACPGCAEHRGPGADPAAPCENPSTCMTCLDCAMFSLPMSLPPGLEARFDGPQMQTIDDWLRHVSSTASASQPQSPSGPVASQHVDAHALPGQFELRFDPSMLQTYALWGEMQDPLAHASPAPEECCGGRCKCPAGFCTCAADCCGCCQGCANGECEHAEDPNRMLTFAVSGERGACCSGRHMPGFASGPPMFSPSMMNAGDRREMGGEWDGQSLEVPRTSLSRASSFSSGSESHLSHVSTPGSGYDRAGAPRSAIGDVQAVRGCCTGLQEMNTGMEQPPSTARRTF